MTLLPVAAGPDTGNGLVERTGKTIGLAWPFHQPVAEIEFNVITATMVELTRLCGSPTGTGSATQITLGIERQQIAAYGIEAEATMTTGALCVFKKQHLPTGTQKILHCETSLIARGRQGIVTRIAADR